MGVSDHQKTVTKYSGIISNCDPSQGKVTVSTAGGAVNITVASVSPLFRWPIVGETWMVRKENGNWTLDSIFQNPDSVAPLSGILPGGAQINATTTIDSLGNQFVTSGNFAWTSYVPAWTTTGTAPVLGNGVLIGRYWKIGKTVSVRISLQSGTTTTYGTNLWHFQLPFPVLADASFQVLNGYAGGTSIYPVMSLLSTNQAAPVANNANITNTTPFTWATNNILIIQGVYECA